MYAVRASLAALFRYRGVGYTDGSLFESRSLQRHLMAAGLAAHQDLRTNAQELPCLPSTRMRLLQGHDLPFLIFI